MQWININIAKHKYKKKFWMNEWIIIEITQQHKNELRWKEREKNDDDDDDEYNKE
jgi:hypothetical protein